MKKIYIIVILFLVILVSGCRKNSNEFDISFMNNEYSIYKVIKTKEGKVKLPNEPYNKDYLFDGWFYDLNYTSPYIEDTRYESNTSFYAKWIKKNITKLELNEPIELMDLLPNQVNVFSFKCNEYGDYLFYSSTGTLNISASLFKIENNQAIHLADSQFQKNRFILPSWLDKNSLYELRLDYENFSEYPSLYVIRN